MSRVSDPICYYLDEHLPTATAVGLRSRGIDVLTAAEAGRRGLPDEEQIRFTTSDGRVMATHDADFLALAADFLARGELFGGVAYCSPSKYQADVGRLVHALVLLHVRLAAADMLNHVEYL